MTHALAAACNKYIKMETNGKSTDVPIETSGSGWKKASGVLKLVKASSVSRDEKIERMQIQPDSIA